METQEKKRTKSPLWLICFVGISSVALQTYIRYEVRSSRVFEVASRFISSNETIRRDVGEVQEIGLPFFGSISSETSYTVRTDETRGKWQFPVEVDGSTGGIRADFFIEQYNDEWTIEANYRWRGKDVSLTQDYRWTEEEAL